MSCFISVQAIYFESSAILQTCVTYLELGKCLRITEARANLDLFVLDGLLVFTCGNAKLYAQSFPSLFVSATVLY